MRSLLDDRFHDEITPKFSRIESIQRWVVWVNQGVLVMLRIWTKKVANLTWPLWMFRRKRSYMKNFKVDITLFNFIFNKKATIASKPYFFKTRLTNNKHDADPIYSWATHPLILSEGVVLNSCFSHRWKKNQPKQMGWFPDFI